MKKVGETGGILLFVGFWSLVTLVFDGMFVANACRNVRANGYASTEGIVAVSEVERKRGSKGGATYALKIRYDYTVNGAKFTGDQYRFGQISASDRWAHATSRKHPAGSKVRVYYDPSQPATSVLQTGIQGVDLFLWLFITPFNIVMLGGWWFVGSTAVGAWFGGVGSTFRQRRETWESRVRLPRTTPLAAAAATLLLASFVSIFIIGLSFGFHPSLTLMLFWWSGMLAVSFAVAMKVWLKAQSGQSDLVVDERRKTLTLPLTFGRRKPITFKCEQVRSIAVDEEVTKGSKGGKHITHVVALRWRDEKGTDYSDTLAKTWKKDEAQKLAEGLRKWLKVREEQEVAAT